MGGKTIRKYLGLNHLELRHWSIGNSNLDTKLELGFGSTVELLVDRRVTAIECYICPGTVGKPLEQYVLSRRNSKKLSKLQRKRSVRVPSIKHWKSTKIR